jgi:hypothetical protein
MRIPDALLMAIVLVAAPTIAWIYGRFAGRRDWKMLPLLGGALLISTATLALMGGAHALAPATLPRALPAGQPLADAATSPEFAAFVVVFSTLIAMLGWSSVPVEQGSARAPQKIS